MARSNIDIAVNVHDAASGKLRQAGNEVGNFGRKVKKAGIDVTQFNRVMFSTTAYIGLFTGGFRKFTELLTEGANLDRLSNQFERVLGPRGEFFSRIKGFTTTAVDRFEAMRSGIELKSLGIVNSTSQIAELVARAGTAAKLAGKDSGEGIKHFTKFLKDGSVTNLEFLNLVARTNPALQAQMAVLHKAGGTMGTVLSTQARLAMGYKLLREATRGAMKGQRDLADIMLDLRQSFTFARASVGTFLGTALAPLLEKVVDLVDKFTDFLENVRKNEKNILFLTKAIIVTTAAVAGLAAAFGTLRLATIALASLGVGLPALVGIIGALTFAFMGVTNGVDGFMNKLKLFAAFFKGTFQLVRSFLQDPENFAKGIGKMDESIAKLLDKNGILGLATNIARVSSVIIRFVSDVGQKLNSWFQTANKFLGDFAGNVANFLGIDAGPWSRNWIESGNSVRDTIVTITAAVAALSTAMRLLGMGSFLGKVVGMLGSLTGVSGAIGSIGGIGGALSGLGTVIGFVARQFAPLAVIGAGVYGAFKGIIETTEEWKKFFTGIFSLGVAVVEATLAFEPLRQAITFVGDKMLEMLKLIAEGWQNLFGWLGIGVGAFGDLAQGIADKISNRNKDQAKVPIPPNVPASKAADTLGASSQTGGQTSAANPAIPETEEAKQQQIADFLKTLDAKQAAQANAAFFSAMSKSSAGGIEITPEEWVSIFAHGLDRSQNLKKVADKEVKSPNPAGAPRR